MKNAFKRFSTVLVSVLTLVLMIGTTVFADGERLDYMDFGETVISINAGESKTIRFRTLYNWTYYIQGATSKKTYLETDFSAGTSYITFHIGEDETAKNVFFHFYIDDEKVQSTDIHDFVEIYVQPAKNAEVQNATPAEAVTNAAPSGKVDLTFADGKSGYAALINDGKVVMMYDAAGTALASFSVSNGSLQKLELTGTTSNGANYFNVKAPANGTVNISDSDKAVMTSKGFGGIYLNGSQIAWP